MLAYIVKKGGKGKQKEGVFCDNTLTIEAVILINQKSRLRLIGKHFLKELIFWFIELLSNEQ